MSHNIVETFLKQLQMLSQESSIRRETELPFPKELIKEAILTELAPLRDVSTPLRSPLVHAYIALARFIPADDAQLFIQTEKTLARIREHRQQGRSPDPEDVEVLAKSEETWNRINKVIDFNERALVADIAALNCNFVIERSSNGYSLHPLSPSNTDQPNSKFSLANSLRSYFRPLANLTSLWKSYLARRKTLSFTPPPDQNTH